MYCRLEIYVPVSHAAAVREAITAAGAGRLGDYDCCVWQSEGIGRFRPLAGSRPAIGRPGVVEAVAECKLETLCERARMPEILRAMRAAHPYETPAFQYWNVEIE